MHSKLYTRAQTLYLGDSVYTGSDSTIDRLHESQNFGIYWFLNKKRGAVLNKQLIKSQRGSCLRNETILLNDYIWKFDLEL